MTARDFFADEFMAAISSVPGMMHDCYFMRGAVRKSCKVRWAEPNRETLTGSQSKEYEIEYLYSDLPDLAEGDILSIDEPIGCRSDFRVREHSKVVEEFGDDGVWRLATLTRDKPRA